MTVTKATNGLQQEHQTIQKVVATMSLAADQLEAGQNVDPAIFGDTITFLRDLSHHYAKEERFLSPLLEARGIPASVLRNEHEMCRGLLAQLDDATQAFPTSGSAKDVLVMSLRALVRLYVDHIWKEYYLLLPISDKVLSENHHAKCASSLFHRGRTWRGQASAIGATLGEIGARPW